MEKKIIFTVKGKTISETCPLHWSSNTVDYIKAGFVLDDEWKSCDVVRAAWSGRQGTIITLLDADDSCVVPHEVLAVYGKVSVNLYGVKYDDGGEEFTRITTAPVTAIIIDATARIDGSETAPITPSQFEQFVQAVRTETEKVTGMTAVAETLPTGSDATASYSDGVLTLGLPRGVKGDAGERGEPGATGPAGATGNGIQSITKTGSSGLVDTYTIRFTDGSSSTFTVTNGQDGSADIHWGDLQGSIADQADLQAALNDKQGKLTAGTNITIDENNVISATGGSGGGAVDSVNGKTGVVVLDADDVGALPTGTRASDIGGYVKPTNGIPKTDLASAVQTSLGKADTALQSAPVTSVNSKTGAVVLSASDVGAYVKPSAGIPKTDLASAVQTSLEKADTALQSAPVTSVNSKTGAVTLTASDVGALPSTTSIPSKTSDLTNDSGYITSAGAPVQSVNGQTGAVTVPDTDTTYTLSMAGNVITLAPSSGTASSITLPVSETEWGDITGTLANQTDLQTALNAKQNTLTAGDNIAIENNVISASGGGSEWRLIADVTTTEAVARVDISTDTDGNPFNIKEMVVWVRIFWYESTGYNLYTFKVNGNDALGSNLGLFAQGGQNWGTFHIWNFDNAIQVVRSAPDWENFGNNARFSYKANSAFTGGITSFTFMHAAGDGSLGVGCQFKIWGK